MITHILMLALGATPPAHAPNPHALVDSAIAAIQRSTSLKDMRSLRLVGVQHEYVLGNAERAEGPWRVTYSTFNELRDLTSSNLRRTQKGVSASGSVSPERVTILTDTVAAMLVGGRQLGLSYSQYDDMLDVVYGSPERALSLAAASSSLRSDGTTRRYGVVFDLVSFPWHGGRMTLEINRETYLPEAVEIVRSYPDNFRWAPFGDVTMRTDYIDWSILPSGARWPMQQKTFFNGEPLRDLTLASATFDTAAVPRDSFVVSDSARRQYAASTKMNFSRFRLGARGEPSELKPGIVRVPDQWMQTLVRQPDGIVLFEAHISAQYLNEVIGEAHKRWPGAPIKALVMTSDPWAHIGGVREAIALGIPIYVNAGSVPFLTRLAKSPHTLNPDALARAPRAPKFNPVTAKTIIGQGENRIELYPVGGPYAERMLMAYFPGHKLLYGADLVFPNRGPDGKVTKGFFETSAVDLRRAVAREKLAVDSLFCVQNYPVMAWQDFVAP